ncbi:bile acid:sodium symporter family protein [Stomatohabitans albus]|uniref:bile acid:sodium symporter family protein n=1 Tax=Stomatohabitans albus TaxID=3110766 RepID=UPI00300CBF29
MSQTQAAPSARLSIDPLSIGVLLMMVLGLIVPTTPAVRAFLNEAQDYAIMLLFLLYGARLPTNEVIDGLKNWKLQGSIFLTTFAIFPLISLVLAPLLQPILTPLLVAGVVYICVLPSTIQSSVALTGAARGNVAGAICAATVSNVGGMFITPFLATILIGGDGTGVGAGVTVDGFINIFKILLAPFIVGQLARPWVGAYVQSKANITKQVDRSVIWLNVFAAVAMATADGVWHDVDASQLIIMGVVCVGLLATVLTITWTGGKLIGMNYGDRVALLMCGSKKSLSSGLPIAAAIFPASILGLMSVPLIVYHQIQLVVCALIAGKLAQAHPDGV